MSDKENDVERSETTFPQSAKTCSKCEELKPMSEFYSTNASYCKSCTKGYAKSYYQKNKEKMKEYFKEYNKNKRLEVLIHYGGNPPKCECCGEQTIEFLAIDHLHNTGHIHREELRASGIALIDWIVKNEFPPYFRVLCHNCNAAQGFYGYCPHQLERR